MMDMDNFKQVNDKHDHLFGSFVLAEVGKLIRSNIRGVDFAARYGGDEFLIVLSETTPEGAKLFAERLRKLIAAHVFTKDAVTMSMGASIGVAVAHPAIDSVDAKGLVRAADHALYEAKRAGKNCVRSQLHAAVVPTTAKEQLPES
jgi:diguanylate cyclase (GGDEF)-like protein